MQEVLEPVRGLKERCKRLATQVARVKTEHVNRSELKDDLLALTEDYFRDVRQGPAAPYGRALLGQLDPCFEELRGATQRRVTKQRYIAMLRDIQKALEAVEMDVLSQRLVPIAVPTDEPTRKCDVAIVCALHKPELQAVLDAFGGEGAWRPGPTEGQPHIYKETDLATDGGGQIRVVAGAPTYMGLTATAIISTQMLLMLRPSLILMVGIAAGTQGGERSFGDILVADPSVDYASGKVSFKDGAEVFHPDPFPLSIDPRLRSFVQEDARTRLGLDEIASTWAGPKPPQQLDLHIGPLGAADQVVNSAHRVAQVTQNWRKLVGIEMETYALYRAAREAPRPAPLFISFKSVCDFADNKGDAWQAYAAYTAAAYCRSFLHRYSRPLGLTRKSA